MGLFGDIFKKHASAAVSELRERYQPPAAVAQLQDLIDQARSFGGRSGSGLSFTAIDFETAAPARASVCQVGVARVYEGRVVLTESWYVQPPVDCDFTNTWVHGVAAHHVVGAPSWAKSREAVLAIANEGPLVSYSPFDRSVWNAADKASGISARSPEFFDALQAAQHHLELESYKLPDVAAHLGVSGFQHHNAGADALAAAEVTLRLAEWARAGSLEDLWGPVSASAAGSKRPYDRYQHKQGRLPETNECADPSHPLFGAVLCFTGDVSGMTRAEAQAAAAALGAKVTSGPTKKTTLVVTGSLHASELNGAATSSKMRRAQELAAAGQPIEFISDGLFLELLAYRG